jgi:hypothetical protein
MHTKNGEKKNYLLILTRSFFFYLSLMLSLSLSLYISLSLSLSLPFGTPKCARNLCFSAPVKLNGKERKESRRDTQISNRIEPS